MEKAMRFKDIEGALRSFDGQSPELIKLRAGHIVCEVATVFYERLNTPFSLACCILLQAGEYAQLVNMTANLGGNTPFEDLAAETFLSKYVGFEHCDLNPQLTAEKKFHEAEEQCRMTNHRLRTFLRSADEDHPMLASLQRISDHIARILGEFDPVEWHASTAFGPGVNVGVPIRGAVSPYHKMLAGPVFSGRDSEFAQGILKTYPGWADASAKAVRLAEGDELDFVNKNAKTKRVILKTSSLSLFLQKGLGSMIRTRLKRVGVDLSGTKNLDTQRATGGQLYHQMLAKHASRLFQHYCTVDLKAASDTIAFILPRSLIDPRWFHAMNLVSAREYTDQAGKVNRLHKFAAMGNGFTFELESLIFYAVAVEASRNVPKEHKVHTSVYGDDVIIAQKAYPRFVELCNFLGFTINAEKSHIDGYFRESCGGNYYDGEEVATLYWKEPITGLQSIFGLTNRLRDRALSATNATVSGAYGAAAARLRRYLPRPARYVRYPENLGVLDVGLAEPVESFEITGYDKDLQKDTYESYVVTAAPTVVQMDNLWAAKAQLLYSVEYHRNDFRHMALATLFGRSAQSLKCDRRGKLIRSVPLGNSSVPVRSPGIVQLKRVQYYIEDMLQKP